MKMLVIGSEGNIGVPLVKHLRAVGHEVQEADLVQGWRPNYTVADINHPLDLVPAFEWGPDVVFLLSAMVSRVTCEQAASLALHTNLAGVNNVVQLAKMCRPGGAKLVFFSTSEVYGPGCDPMSEMESNPQPNNRYGFSKWLGEKIVEYEVNQHKLQAVIIRPFMMYDENEDFGDHRSAMIRFAWNLAQNKVIEVHRGSARGWLHASDAVNAIERAACMQLKNGDIFNIGHPDIRPMDALAHMIAKRLGKPEELIKTVDFPERMTAVKRPTLLKQKDVLCAEPKVSLDEGVDRVCVKVIERLEAK